MMERDAGEFKGVFGFDSGSTLFESTPVENMFIQEYMLGANGDFVKAYLYALMQCHYPRIDASFATTARDLGLDEDQLRIAYAYWERLGFMRRVSDNPPRYVCCNVKKTLQMRDSDDDGLYKYADFNQRLAALFGADRQLRPEDYQTAIDWIETVRLPEPVALKLVEYGIVKFETKKFSFKRLEKTAAEWAESGVKTEADAQTIIHRAEALNNGLKDVVRRLGRRGGVSEDDVELYLKWTDEWGFTKDAILTACAETTKGAPTMAYLDGILKRQHGLGKHDAPAIQAQWSRERDESDAVRPILDAIGVRGTAPTKEWTQSVELWRGRGFSPGSLLMAAGQVSRYGGKLDDFERLLDSWLRQGLTEENAVEEHLTRVQAMNMRLNRLFQLAGWDKPPTARDRAALNNWRAQGISDELIEVAAEFANGMNQPVAYMDKLLKTWLEIGAISVAQARAEHDAHIARRGAETAGSTAGGSASPSIPQSRRPSKEVAEHRYTQREYDDDEMYALAVNWSGDTDAGRSDVIKER